jgi:copper(I)-binding protein
MIMENQSDKSQSLTSVSASAFGRVMIHRTEQKDGMAHMAHQKQVTIPANGKVVFAPGGYHLMLMYPKRSLHADDQATLNFVFADESKLSVIFKVRKDMLMKDEEDMKRHHGM